MIIIARRRHGMLRLSVVCGLLLSNAALAQTPPTLEEQVSHCMRELDIQAPIPALSCMGPDTLKTLDSPPDSSEFLGYKRITDEVDAVYHCDHVNEAARTFIGKVELTLHNRTSGKTCFFEDAEKIGNESVDVPSLTAPNARDYWQRGSTQFGSRDNPACADCHTTGGPYLISSRSVTAMERFGLINNGHDTLGNRFRSVNADSTVVQRENDLMKTAEPPLGCGTACHNLRTSTPVGIAASELVSAGLMPPTADRYSPFRSINRDTPNGTGDWEQLEFVRTQFPDLHCAQPLRMQARTVGSPRILETDGPHRLKTFNLRDGLECVNSEQPNGACPDYQVRYLCPDGNWSSWYNRDSPANSGDYERRSDAPNLCANPQAIQALSYIHNETGSTVPSLINGPNDRLFQFNKYGLVCRNADQGAGQACSNYVVKFICP